MARLKLTLDVPDVPLSELKQYVHDVDEDLSGDGNGIDPKNVSTLDIVTTLVSGGSYEYRVVEESGRTKLQQMGQMLNDIVMNPGSSFNEGRLRGLNDIVYDMARQQAGVSAADVADENMENDPRVLHYWSLTSSLMAKVYMEAAQQLHYVKEWD